MEDNFKYLNWKAANNFIHRGLLIKSESYEDEELKSLAEEYERIYWRQVEIQSLIRKHNEKV